MFTLGAVVAVVLDDTLGRSDLAGDNDLCDFALDKIFHLLVKMLDKCFNASEISFLSLNSGNNLSEERVLRVCLLSLRLSREPNFEELGLCEGKF